MSTCRVDMSCQHYVVSRLCQLVVSTYRVKVVSTCRVDIRHAVLYGSTKPGFVDMSGRQPCRPQLWSLIIGLPFKIIIINPRARGTAFSTPKYASTSSPSKIKKLRSRLQYIQVKKLLSIPEGNRIQHSEVCQYQSDQSLENHKVTLQAKNLFEPRNCHLKRFFACTSKYKKYSGSNRPLCSRSRERLVGSWQLAVGSCWADRRQDRDLNGSQ